MVYRSIFLSFILIWVASASYGQKVKYKDLFLLLDAREFDKAEPFLRKFLTDNPEHPNALLFMGIIYQEKSNKEDVIKQTDLLTHHIDSAVIFYEKAYKKIDEREVKKNDEYYESYKRRDLRTGEFSIKLSDVQYDIDKRIQGLKEKKTRIFTLKEQLTAAETYYNKSLTRFQSLQAAYGAQKDLLLQSDDAVVATLNGIVTAFDTSMTAFRSYKATSQLLGKTGYNQVLALQEIKDFKKDGTTPSDFLQDDLKVWDLKSWSQAALTSIDKEIKPLRDGLIAYDIEINKLGEKVKKDSVDVRTDLGQLALKSPVAALKKNDPDPLPAAVFDMKIAELYYACEVISHRATRDSVNVTLQLRNVDAELRSISKLDSISAAVMQRDMDKDGENYKHFITSAYGTIDVLKSLVRTTNDFARREKLKKLRESESKSQSMKWIINATDSVPLFTDETSGRYKFKPLVIVPEEHTMGLQYADSVATGYFYTITPSRIPDVKATFPVDKVNFTRRNLPIIKGLTTRDDKGLVYFSAIYSEAKTHDKYSVVIAKIYRSDGLAWSRTYLMDMLPSSLIFDPATGELSVKTVSPAGDSKIVTLDKNGKQLQ